MGVHLSIDDFGTGYSSLSYLKRFPVEALKIDRSFIDGLGREHEDTSIVEAIVTLAHALGLTAVAEGLETETQLEALRVIGCDYAQGYLLGRPLPGRDRRRQPRRRSHRLAHRSPAGGASQAVADERRAGGRRTGRIVACISHDAAHEPGQTLAATLEEPGFYAGDPFPHYARLRREAPVAWNAQLGYWAVAEARRRRRDLARIPKRSAPARGSSPSRSASSTRARRR